MKKEKLYHNDWLSLHMVTDPENGVSGYVYSHEERCGGHIVALLPFHNEGFLVRKEITPCWGMSPKISALTGGVDNHDVPGSAIQELDEEAGYTITEKELVSLGVIYGTKSSDTKYHLFTVNLEGIARHKAKGDGSYLEETGECIWETVPFHADCAILMAMYGRFVMMETRKRYF